MAQSIRASVIMRPDVSGMNSGTAVMDVAVMVVAGARVSLPALSALK